MNKSTILLSGGIIPWLGLTKSLKFVREVGCDGLEVVPVRSVISEIENAVKKHGERLWAKEFKDSKLIKSVHHSWRLDLGKHDEYGIDFFPNIIANATLLTFFPSNTTAVKYLSIVIDTLNCPITVHDLSKIWTDDLEDQEFSGEILYEILGPNSENPDNIKRWLLHKNHKLVVDTRDDQSLLWARKHGFANWQTFWQWVGTKKIGNVQLTLMGQKGMGFIFDHKKTLAEEEFLWLNENNWHGSVTIEANPIMLFYLCRGNIKRGLRTIIQFIQTTLNEGKRWS